MVAIAGGKPVQMGLKALLTHFIEHRKRVVTRRTQYELEQARARAHILEGLIVAVDNLDEAAKLVAEYQTEAAETQSEEQAAANKKAAASSSSSSASSSTSSSTSTSSSSTTRSTTSN